MKIQRFLIITCLLLANLTLGLSSVFAQSKSSRKKNELKLPLAPELNDLLKKAIHLEKKGNYALAHRLYLKILEDDDNSVFKTKDGHYRGIYPFVLEKLRSLSKPGIKSFRRNYGQKAQILLEEVTQGDINSHHLSLRKVAETYFPTEAGIKANLLMANLLLEEGRSREAFERLYHLLQIPSGMLPNSLSPSLLLTKSILAIKGLTNLSPRDRKKIKEIYRLCQKAKGLEVNKKKIQPQEYFHSVLERFLTFQIQLRHSQTSLRGRIKERKKGQIIVDHGGKLKSFSTSQIKSIKAPKLALDSHQSRMRYNIREDSPQLGGDNSHNGISASLPRMGSDIVDSLSVAYRDLRKKFSSNSRRYEWRRGRFVLIPEGEVIYPYHPTIYNDWLYVAAHNRLIGYNLKKTYQKFRVRPVPGLRKVETNSEMVYAPLVHKDRVYSTFITSIIRQSEHFKTISIKAEIPMRRLMCFNRFNGKKIWEKDGSEDPFFKDVSVPITPIIRDGVLYAMAYRLKGYVQTFVVAIDAETGKTLWKRWLASGTMETTMFGYHAREPLSSMLAEAQGVIYCCTNQGVISALRVGDGKMLWMRSYDTLTIRAAHLYSPVKRKIKWMNNPPIVAGDSVCVAPLDSRYFYVLDKNKGTLRWKKPRQMSRGSVKHLLGVAQGKVLLSGRRVVAYSLDTGSVEWKSQLYGAKPKGRGMICQDALVLPAHAKPTRSNRFKSRDKLYVIDLETGRHRRHVNLPSGTSAGNLVVTNQYIALVSGKKVSVFKNKD